MIVGFFGHSELLKTDEIEKELRALADRVIGNREVEFWLGTYGAFDRLSCRMARNFKKSHASARLVLVPPYLDSYAVCKEHSLYDALLYPPIEAVPKRLAILARNRYVARNADVIFAYVEYAFGGAAKALAEARRAKKIIYNLAEIQ